MDHHQAHKEVLKTTRAYLVAKADRDDAIDLLVKDGFTRVAASLRADLIPMAFGWALLKKMGVEKFPSEISLSDTKEVAKVLESHIFTAALSVAFDVFQNGYNDIFSQQVVEMIISHSAEVDALNRALNSNPNINLSEASINSSLFGYTYMEFIENA